MPHKHSVTYIIKEESELKKHKQFDLLYISEINPGTGALLSSSLYKQWRGDANMGTVCTFILQRHVSRRRSFIDATLQV